MEQKLAIIAFFAVLGGTLYWLTLHSTPNRGWLKVCERFFVGVAIVYLVNLCLGSLSFQMQQNPLSSFAAGYLGVPGAAFAFVMQNMP